MVISGGQDKPKKTTSWHYLRLLLTDSGHYLPPVDDTRGVSGHTKDEIEKQMFTWYQGFQNKRNDVRHCFLLSEQACHGRERERCEEQRQPADSNPVKTTSSTTSLMTEADIESTCVTGSNPKATSSTTSGHVKPQPQSQSGSLTAEVSADVLQATLPGKPFLDGPPQYERLPEIDSWTIEEGHLVRHHRVPRRMLFTPNCATGCPIDPALILGGRTSHMYLIPRKRGEPGRVAQSGHGTVVQGHVEAEAGGGTSCNRTN